MLLFVAPPPAAFRSPGAGLEFFWTRRLLSLSISGLRIAHEAMLAVQGAIRLLHKACGLLPIVRHAWRAACGVRRMAHNARAALASV